MGNKGSFVFYTEYREHLSMLPPEQVGELMFALMDYQETGEVPDLPKGSALAMCFSFIKARMDKDNSKYEEKCERNRSNGKKGGRPIKEAEISETEANPNKPNGFSENRTVISETEANPTEPKKADNDNVNDNNNSLSSAHTRENLGDISSETFDMDLDKCFADLKSEEGWLRDAWERAYRNGFRNFTLDECKDKYVDLYYWKLKGEGVTHKSVSDAKRHFSNWLITELKKQKDDRARTKTFSRATTDPTGKVICGETETGTDIQSGGASQKDYSARF